eukprot:gene23246-29450_t
MPSCRPTSVPSSQPSSLPTGLPSALPTRRPTKVPTAIPSSSPSLTYETKWEDKLTGIARNISLNGLVQANYNELVVDRSIRYFGGLTSSSDNSIQVSSSTGNSCVNATSVVVTPVPGSGHSGWRTRACIQQVPTLNSLYSHFTVAESDQMLPSDLEVLERFEQRLKEQNEALACGDFDPNNDELLEDSIFIDINDGEGGGEYSEHDQDSRRHSRREEKRDSTATRNSDENIPQSGRYMSSFFPPSTAFRAGRQQQQQQSSSSQPQNTTSNQDTGEMDFEVSDIYAVESMDETQAVDSPYARNKRDTLQTTTSKNRVDTMLKRINSGFRATSDELAPPPTLNHHHSNNNIDRGAFREPLTLNSTAVGMQNDSDSEQGGAEGSDVEDYNFDEEADAMRAAAERLRQADEEEALEQKRRSEQLQSVYKALMPTSSIRDAQLQRQRSQDRSIYAVSNMLGDDSNLPSDTPPLSVIAAEKLVLSPHVVTARTPVGNKTLHTQPADHKSSSTAADSTQHKVAPNVPVFFLDMKTLASTPTAGDVNDHPLPPPPAVKALVLTPKPSMYSPSPASKVLKRTPSAMSPSSPGTSSSSNAGGRARSPSSLQRLNSSSSSVAVSPPSTTTTASAAARNNTSSNAPPQIEEYLGPSQSLRGGAMGISSRQMTTTGTASSRNLTGDLSGGGDDEDDDSIPQFRSNYALTTESGDSAFYAGDVQTPHGLTTLSGSSGRLLDIAPPSMSRFMQPTFARQAALVKSDQKERTPTANTSGGAVTRDTLGG